MHHWCICCIVCKCRKLILWAYSLGLLHFYMDIFFVQVLSWKHVKKRAFLTEAFAKGGGGGRASLDGSIDPLRIQFVFLKDKKRFIFFKLKNLQKICCEVLAMVSVNFFLYFFVIGIFIVFLYNNHPLQAFFVQSHIYLYMQNIDMSAKS